MELRRELFLAIGAVMLLNVLLAFGAIGLFVRMGPAIERILSDNDTSIAAAEDVLTILANAHGESLDESQDLLLSDAFERLRGNVTESGENPALGRVADDLDALRRGDPEATSRAVAALREVIDVNRGAMRGVDAEARRLGGAGAWAAVGIGFLSFLGSLFVIGRVRRRVVAPLVELHEVLTEHARGDVHRRCRTSNAPVELRRVLEAVNRLLDRRG
ncbi:MAG: hypothetical protein KC591_10975 [Gemmatimonadetes bacterium]|nr:hypothetical protein [Gemmatimonadota bacterium]